MTVTELKHLCETCEEMGLGGVEIGIPADSYNEWINGITKLQFRPFINAIAICDCTIESGGIDIITF